MGLIRDEGTWGHRVKQKGHLSLEKGMARGRQQGLGGWGEEGNSGCIVRHRSKKGDDFSWLLGPKVTSDRCTAVL
jgi:hypothetical protein